MLQLTAVCSRAGLADCSSAGVSLSLFTGVVSDCRGVVLALQRYTTYGTAVLCGAAVQSRYLRLRTVASTVSHCAAAACSSDVTSRGAALSTQGDNTQQG